MLKNFLQALANTGADKKLKRVILVNGAKHYGAHLGPTKIPFEEDDPRAEGQGRPPNFYYNQQDILASVAKGKSWDWVRMVENSIESFLNYPRLSLSQVMWSVLRKVRYSFLFSG